MAIAQGLGEARKGRPEKVRLGEILLQQKLLTEEQLQHRPRGAEEAGRRLGRVVIEKGYATEEQISQALARQLGVPFINLKQYNIKREVVLKLPETQARRFRALVLEDAGAACKVGMADPTDLAAYDEIARILKRDIELAVVTETELLRAIDRIYRRTEQITGLAQELEVELGEITVVDFGALALTPGLEEAPVVKLLQTVFEDAMQARASDIHIEPQEKRLHIRFRIDGVLHLQTEADPKIATAAGAAAEADVRARHLGEAAAAGRPLQRQGAQHPDRRADFDHADAVRRIGGDAPAQPGERHARARQHRHAGRHAGASSAK